MTIYKLNINIYTYWLTCDRGGFEKEEKYFSTKEKAEHWIKEHNTKMYGFNGTLEEIDKEYKKPTFEIEEIEVD